MYRIKGLWSKRHVLLIRNLVCSDFSLPFYLTGLLLITDFFVGVSWTASFGIYWVVQGIRREFTL